MYGEQRTKEAREMVLTGSEAKHPESEFAVLKRSTPFVRPLPGTRSSDPHMSFASTAEISHSHAVKKVGLLCRLFSLLLVLASLKIDAKTFLR